MEKSYEKIRQLVEVNNFQEACNVLKTTCLKTEGINLYSRLKELEKEISLGLVDYSNINIRRNRIRHELLNCANNLENIELEESKQIKLAELTSIANTLYQQEKYTEALIAYNDILSLIPNQIDALINIGRIYCILERYDLALKKYSQALKVNHLSDRAINNMGVSFEKMQNFEEALSNYQKALSINPEEILYFNNLIGLLKRLNRHSEAIEHCSYIISIHPYNPHFYYTRCMIYSEHFKSYQNALQDINTAIRLNKSVAEYFFERGSIYCKLQNLQAAIFDFNQSINLAPNDIYYSKYKVATLMDYKYFNDALLNINDLIPKFPSEPSLLLMKGICQYELKQYDNAIQALLQCVYRDRNECDAYHYLGHAYRVLNYHDTANNYYQKSKSCYDLKTNKM